MSEQKNDGNEPTTQTPEPGTAPEQKEKVTFDEGQQAILNKVGAEGRENVRVERQKTADLQKQLEEAQAKVPKVTRPNVADALDSYDENYDASLQTREKQIREQAEFDTRQQIATERTQEDLLTEQQRQQTAFNDSLVKFNGTATNFDITPEALQVMDTTIAGYGGLSPSVGNRVLNDDNGMLVYQHFAQHPEDISKVNQMSEGDAAIFVNDVKTKAVALRTKRPSGAPDPAENLSGSGVPPAKRGVEGTTYE